MAAHTRAPNPNPPLVVLVPTRGRAAALPQLAMWFAETTPLHRMLFICDPDDPDSIEVAEGLGDVVMCPLRMSYPEKINLGIDVTVEPLLLCGADDIKPHPRWLFEALELMTAPVGFVALNDLGNLDVMDGKYATLPLVARWYADLGAIDGAGFYHEGYHHNGADLEASETAQARGAFAYAPAAVMEHLHPNYDKAEMDQTYRDGGFNEEGANSDNELLDQRRKLWT